MYAPRTLAEYHETYGPGAKRRRALWFLKRTSSSLASAIGHQLLIMVLGCVSWLASWLWLLTALLVVMAGVGSVILWCLGMPLDAIAFTVWTVVLLGVMAGLYWLAGLYHWYRISRGEL